MRTLKDAFWAQSFNRYTGDKLRSVVMPIGGIGTGTVGLTGRGSFTDWEIFNRSAVGLILPYTFGAISVSDGSTPAAPRLLEGPFLPSFQGETGLPAAWLSGAPRFREAAFAGAYPFCTVQFTDPARACPRQARSMESVDSARRGRVGDAARQPSL